MYLLSTDFNGTGELGSVFKEQWLAESAICPTFGTRPNRRSITEVEANMLRTALEDGTIPFKTDYRLM